MEALVHSWGMSRFSEGMAMQWLTRTFGGKSDHGSQQSDDADDSFMRLRKWILMQLNHQRVPDGMSHWQRGCPEMIPSLRAQPQWDCEAFPWIATLERMFPVIKEELLALKHKQGFQPYRAPTWASSIRANDGLGSVGHDAGDWNVFYLFLHNVDFSTNRALCPNTVAVIKSISSHYDHAFFSALAPQTHIKKHHGPTNKKLRCHLPLIVPKDKCRLRVGDETIYVQEGKCFVFNDSFEHEAWNDDPHHSRIVLIVDVWHPDLSAQEQKFFSFVRNSQLRMDKKQATNHEESTTDNNNNNNGTSDSNDNFYKIIQDASQVSHGAASHAAIWR
uniref:Aspartyl/asparaginy/proline hydroxylase domain-containing protein n=1 Tax=Globisporangium ultimum (strain ATCC 200006 / CBS 805.95 / DAOM BR144) TaxID=431595 RepID=K3W7Q2_GLOUD